MTSLESSPGWHSTQTASASFEPLGARRLFLLGGIGLILIGMLFGDIFAVFVLHQNAERLAQISRRQRMPHWQEIHLQFKQISKTSGNSSRIAAPKWTRTST